MLSENAMQCSAKEFQRRRSFAYIVVTPPESMIAGCVYINPAPERGYDK